MKPSSPHLHFGSGGVPLSTHTVTAPNGIKYDLRHSALFRLEEMDLDLMELEFVYGVNIDEPVARSLGELAKQKNIALTVHGPYYINLASKERPKYHASISRVQKTILAAHWLQATSLTFHPGFYQGRTQDETTILIEAALLESVSSDTLLQKVDGEIPLISLETTGKPSQWGSLGETVETAAKLNDMLGRFQFSACVDFAHIHARSNGEWNSYDEFTAILDKVERALGKESLEHLHIHMSGINYSNKGEKNHLVLEKSDMRYQELIKALRDKHVSGWVVCESPNLEEDAKTLQSAYQSNS
jgi:deoxyribonuclease IV